MATLRAECSFEWEPVSKEPRAQRPGLSQFWGQPVSVVELSDTAQAREVRRLRQENAELRRTIDAVGYMLRETQAFDPAEHPWCVQARATREALLANRTDHAA